MVGSPNRHRARSRVTGSPTLAYAVRVAVCAWMLVAAGPSAQTLVRLVPQPGVAPGVAAFPRLAPSGPASAVINGALSAADARVRAAAADCTAGLAGSNAGPDRHAWTRRVTVGMRGPRYLALITADDADCGGVYPNADRFALVYDLRTGHPPDWSRLLPTALARLGRDRPRRDPDRHGRWPHVEVALSGQRTRGGGEGGREVHGEPTADGRALRALA